MSDEESPEWEDDPERWVEKRTQFLSSAEIGLREKVAEAVAWGELGYSRNGISKRMGTAPQTVKSYLDAAEEVHSGITYQIVGIDVRNVDDLVTGGQAPSRECPCCLKDRVLTPEGAKRVFLTSGWGSKAMLEDADLVCSYCHSVRIDGVWRRMKSAESRAWELAEGSSSKDKSDYLEILTSGKDTGKPTPKAKDAEGW